ncbi:hypothetical protein CYLTODRAFT_419546 [Cylindrobasidium torrendii FP15055 ss-10]|uniref:Uncharacterized protein n=1 Tax=Cylindrobasidium torrendii FP15055 ss-10 TaxID=1314674 RepID=A0A0D7BJT8_9AGAR|nr:hypothetical protein CYLTODRAFT_419546 [Cylindrobasidium torrendii FP15055 ss-10]
MDNLPLEILQDIFELSCIGPGPSLGVCLCLGPYTLLPVQHQLLMVSRLWRDVATSTQSLWTTIFASCVNDSGEKKEEKLRFLRLALGRSGTALLDIHVVSCWEAVAEYLIPKAYRWRMLTVGTSDLYADLSSFAGLQGKLPALVAFELDDKAVDPNQRSQVIGWLSDAFSHSHLIREVLCYSELLEVRFPWHQLTSLNVKFIPLPTQAMDDAVRFKGLLESCKSLKRLSINGQPPLALPFRNTTVQELVHPDPLWLWFLTLPALRKLVLRGFSRHIDCFPLCIDFIQRSRCSLTSLQLEIPITRWTSVTISSFQDVLKLVPCLQSLLLEAPTIVDESPPACYPADIPSLCQPLHDPKVLPALVNFDIVLSQGTKQSAEHCMEALRVWLAVVSDVVGARRASMKRFDVNVRAVREETQEHVTRDNVESMVEIGALQARAREVGIKGHLWVTTLRFQPYESLMHVSKYDIEF